MWVPLLILSVAEGHAWGAGVALPFLQDIEAHLRMLVAVPLLIAAEVMVHRSLLPIVRAFPGNGLVRADALPLFDAAIDSALRLRNSVVIELLLIAFVYAVALPFVWRDQLAMNVNSWYATVANGKLQPTYAGWWLGLVCMPIIQFLMLRWFFRIFIWARFLWQVARMRLDLQPTHPDGTAGLLFLARSGRAYRLLLLAVGTCSRVRSRTGSSMPARCCPSSRWKSSASWSCSYSSCSGRWSSSTRCCAPPGAAE